MARPLNAIDWLVIIALIVVAAVIIYFLWPLAVAVAIIAAAYFIYKWYTGQRPVRMH
jgi:hypothetical protein